MTTDGGGYTYWPCSNCPSTNIVTAANGCADAVGLKMVIPRTQNHWASIMFAFVEGQLGQPRGSFFSVVPGIFRPAWYLGACRGQGPYGVMNSDSCSGLGSWQALDGGAWWIRSSTYSEPNGDYAANSFLGPRSLDDPGDTSFNDY